MAHFRQSIAAIALLLCSVNVGGVPTDEFRDKLYTFHRAYDTFLRKYIGCPPPTAKVTGDGYEQVQCDSLKGVLDQKAWRDAREAAKSLFELEDKR